MNISNDNNDNEINSMISIFSELKFKNKKCVICKKTTIETIHNVCFKNCSYVCHGDCLKTWIHYKKYDASCVICGSQYSIDLIDKVIYQQELYK